MSGRMSCCSSSSRRIPFCWALPILLGGVLVLWGCAEGPPETDEALSEADRELAVERGEPAAGALAQGLVGRLSAALDEGGPAYAVEFCSQEAIPLTRSIEAEMENGLELKRTTLRWRNPDNAPDPWEEAALQYMQELEETEEGAPEAITGPGPDGTLRYYRTLRTGPQCLACHGGEADLDPEAARLIADAYPEDQATGYTEGEFRGLIRVQIPR